MYLGTADWSAVDDSADTPGGRNIGPIGTVSRSPRSPVRGPRQCGPSKAIQTWTTTFGRPSTMRGRTTMTANPLRQKDSFRGLRRKRALLDKQSEAPAVCRKPKRASRSPRRNSEFAVPRRRCRPPLASDDHRARERGRCGLVGERRRSEPTPTVSRRGPRPSSYYGSGIAVC